MSKIDLTSYPKDRIKVLFLENISDKAVQYFKQQGYADVKTMRDELDGKYDLYIVLKKKSSLAPEAETWIKNQ